MEAAAQCKHHGRRKQVAGTAGIESEARRGVKIMRELDAILTDLLEENEPLLAAGKPPSKSNTSPKVAAASRRWSSDSPTQSIASPSSPVANRSILNSATHPPPKPQSRRVA